MQVKTRDQGPRMTIPLVAGGLATWIASRHGLEAALCLLFAAMALDLFTGKDT